MHIDRTDGCSTPGVPEGAPGLPRVGPESGPHKAGHDAVVLDESAIAALVRKATEVAEVNSAAVAEARRLLQSTQLDTPEAALRAAESLLNRGI